MRLVEVIGRKEECRRGWRKPACELARLQGVATGRENRRHRASVLQYGARSIGTWSVRTHCIQPITTHTEISKRSDWLMSTDPVPILMAPYCSFMLRINSLWSLNAGQPGTKTMLKRFLQSSSESLICTMFSALQDKYSVLELETQARLTAHARSRAECVKFYCLISYPAPNSDPFNTIKGNHCNVPVGTLKS
jgi:hypothetical protein